RRFRVRRAGDRPRAHVRPGRLHHALFRLRPHRRSNQAVTVLPLTPAGLRCAHQVDPLGVAPDRVRLSWRLEGPGTGRAQHAYQVLVTPEKPGAAAAWDSGQVESALTADIAYGGEASGGHGGVA